MTMRCIGCAVTTRVITLVLGLASITACGDTSHDVVVTFEPFELRAGEPRDIRWLLCKEGAGTHDFVSAKLDLQLDHQAAVPGSVEARRWPSKSAYEAGDEPMPFDGGEVLVTSRDHLRVELRPSGAFTLDGRQCTGDQFVRLDGSGVLIEAAIEASVLDYNQVIDRLVLEAELLP
jgi:hypothetical protein